MTDFRFVPVEELEGDPPLIIGLSGMSDSGKTYSALLIAQAIARQRGGIVAGIDTEGRMKKYRDATVYAELHPFRAVRWTAPFDGDRAIKACQAAIEAGAACIILDSASRRMGGRGRSAPVAGGATSPAWPARITTKREKMPTWSAWAKAKKPASALARSSSSGSPCRSFFCHRARRKIKMTGGKVIDMGVQPICDDRLVYDMMFHLLMDEQARDGSYAVLKGGYKHERGVFPGGKVDAAAIARLLAVTTDAEPAAGIQWTLAADGSHRYEPNGDVDINSADSQRALFETLREALKGPADDARTIAAANQEAIMALPEKGRAVLLQIIERRKLTTES